MWGEEDIRKKKIFDTEAFVFLRAVVVVGYVKYNEMECARLGLGNNKISDEGPREAKKC